MVTPAKKTAGYSGTPLVKKLGVGRDMTLVALGAPKEYRALLGGLPEGARIVTQAGAPLAAVHVFTKDRAELAKTLKSLRKKLEPAGFVWVSWPKKASKVATNVTEDVVREVALPMGFVDVKVCAVSEVWSGLKLVIRKGERGR